MSVQVKGISVFDNYRICVNVLFYSQNIFSTKCQFSLITRDKKGYSRAWHFQDMFIAYYENIFETIDCFNRERDIQFVDC